jgi:hypothetical protein
LPDAAFPVCSYFHFLPILFILIHTRQCVAGFYNYYFVRTIIPLATLSSANPPCKMRATELQSSPKCWKRENYALSRRTIFLFSLSRVYVQWKVSKANCFLQCRGDLECDLVGGYLEVMRSGLLDKIYHSNLLVCNAQLSFSVQLAQL